MEEALQLIPGTVVRRQHPDFNLNFKREKMKKVNLLLWPLLFSAVCILSSCKDTEDKSNAVPVKGDNITFSATTQTTRTTVDPNDPLQLDWTEGDKVRIACDQSAAAKESDYSVKVSGSRNAGDLTAASIYPNEWLMWGEDNNLYKFYAAYPADSSKVKINSSTGVATFTLNQNQECTISGNAVNNQYTATPEPDKNAYMVANNNTYPTKKPISLDFKPIMTTINFTVNGPAEANQKMRLTGLAIIFSSKDVKSSEPYDQTVKFDYDIKKGEMVSGSGDEETNTVLVNVKQGDNHYIDLSSGQSVKLTAYLPPFAVNENNKLKIRVLGSYGKLDESADAVSSMIDAQAEFSKSIPAGNYASINLPPIKEDADKKNNWITPLDGDILVSQLSIPGAHDAMANAINMSSETGKNYAVTQGQSFDNLWRLGVRCFQIGVSIWDNNIDGADDAQESIHNYGEQPLWVYAGLLRTKVGWSNSTSSPTDENGDGNYVGAIDMIHQKLQQKQNAGEFAVVILNHENNKLKSALGYEYTSQNKNLSSILYNQKMTAWMNSHKDWFVEWSPMLTINDCRGKIVLLTRKPNDKDRSDDNNTTGKNKGDIVTKWDWTTGGFIENGPDGWPDNYELATPTDITKNGPLTPTVARADGNYMGRFVMQDLFNYQVVVFQESKGDAFKFENIKKLLDITTTQLNKSGATYYNCWAINFLSAYWYHNLLALAAELPSTNKYIDAAQNQNKNVYNYLLSHVGPTGILMCDYLGVTGYDDPWEPNGLRPVYGDILLQSIINNNYRYRMLRKSDIQ